jgi:hypothetical protein
VYLAGEDMKELGEEDEGMRGLLVCRLRHREGVEASKSRDRAVGKDRLV